MVWQFGSTVRVRKRGRFAPMEGITRPSAAERVLQKALARVKPDDDGEADFRFGKAANFNPPTQPTRPSTTVNWPDDEETTDPGPEFVLIDYDEVARDEEEIRVENPDDSEQYVMVKRCLVWLGRRRDTGDFVRLNFKYPEE